MLKKYLNVKLLALLLLVPFLWVMAGAMGWLSYMEYMTVDWRFRARGELESPVKLVYVDLDSEAVEYMGERPIPRAYFAEAIEGLFKYGGVKVVGLDIVFSEYAYSKLVDEAEVKRDTAELRRVLAAYPGLILSAAYTAVEPEDADDEPDARIFPYMHLGYTDRSRNDVPELPEWDLTEGLPVTVALIGAASHYSPGAADRWIPLFANAPEKTYFALSLEMLRTYWGIPKESMTVEEDQIVLKNGPDGDYEIPLNDGQLLEVNWFSPWVSEQNVRLSLRDAIEAKRWMESGEGELEAKAKEFYRAFDGGMVLIGAVDPLLQEMAPAPFQPNEVPTVGVHGNAIKTMASGDFLVRFPGWVNGVIAYLFTFLAGGFAAVKARRGARGISPRWGSFLSILGYMVFSFYMFAHWDWVLPVVVPMGAALSTTFLIIIQKLVQEEKKRGHLQDLFGTYVSRDLVEQMVERGEDPKLGGAEQEVSAFFSDIQNFTVVSELLTPQHLIGLINEYLTEMTAIIQEERGTLDKYIGDAIVAMFGAPLKMERHALAACRTACRMQTRQLELCARWSADSRDWAHLVSGMRTRIGINSGTATIGNMGSDIRFDYTMLGDNVNLASRCEAANKVYGVFTLVTERTRRAAEAESEEMIFRYLDKIVVKGKTVPVSINELVGFKGELSEEAMECVGLYESAMERYLERDWERAIRLFGKSAELERYLPQSEEGAQLNPSVVFMQRSRELQEAPDSEIQVLV